MKIKKSDLLNMIQEQNDSITKIWDVLDSLNVDVFDNKKAIIKMENEREQSKLKQLDQSAFDHPYATDRFKYVALNADGQAVFFESKPVISNCLDIWVVHTGSVMPMLKGYDTSNWQNSLIERDIAKELTGSELCRAMLERGDKYVMCKTSGTGEAEAMEAEYPDVIQKYDWEFFYTPYKKRYAVPINNQGEPLTQAEAGL